MSVQEFEREPVSPERLEPARHFAASYAGEHVAGTEFVIGALFVAWGVGTVDILTGLVIGNLLAVLTWTFICAPIAVDTRLTLYAYIEKIAGPGTVKLYSVVNGVLFCVLAGAMITVSASAIRILFNLPPQVNWYPTNIGFVAVALVVGAVVVVIAIKGFKRVAQFAEVCAPWMILMFFAGALATLPMLVSATPGIDGIGSFSDFVSVGDAHIWRDTGSELGMWHVAAFAWVCNLAMHGGLSDMTILRFARKYQYGYFSALGMFVGHFLAWICAGIMGAGAALMMQTSIAELDAGGVAYQALGATGIIAVIIAGWTTSNPTIYRAGLAFQSINPNWSRVKVTAVAGAVTTVIACFPFVFTKLMDFVGLMGLIIAPLGAVLVTEHWVFPRIGKTRYWAKYRQINTNMAAVVAWLASLLIAFILNRLGLHLFFLLIPTWFSAMIIYTVLASMLGANSTYAEQAGQELQSESERKESEQRYLKELSARNADRAATGKATNGRNWWFWAALASLLCCLVLAVLTFNQSLSLEQMTGLMIWPTLAYFVTATRSAIVRERQDERLQAADN
ncbi:MAG: purine-cytosine permease family protein [Porticoccaceae bacterium]